MDINKIILRATGGQDTICADFMPATGARPLIFDDPGLLWLEHHGEDNDFHKDTHRFQLLPFLSELGRQFEEAYIRHEAPNAIRLMEHDGQVRNRASFQKTIEHLQRGTQFLWHCALWWYPQQIYGAADALVHTSWLYKRYPHLKPTDEEPPHHVVIDFKFSQKLDSTGKKAHLEHATTQVRLYSYILGHLQGFMPSRAYIISRDTIDTPLVVAVDLKLNQPLDEELTDLRDAYLEIKLRGGELRPWKDKRVQLNPQNTSDAPWSEAKEAILREKVRPRSLMLLPGVGKETARKMRLHGFDSIDDLLARDIARLRLEEVDGICPALAERLRAVLQANKTGQVSAVPASLVPRKADVELHVDMEYLSSLNVDFDAEWPHLSGKALIFMIGCGYKEQGEWRFKRFTAESETPEAEEKMLRQFLAFLRKRGVFDPTKTVALYHWSSAEVWQARQAAQRHGLGQLESLPFVDLRQVFLQGPVALPRMWSFGLKEVGEALGDYAPRYRVEWPQGLSSGNAAQIAGWAAFDQEAPLKTPEMRLIADYLLSDCQVLERILAWLRNTAKSAQRKASDGLWYGRGSERPVIGRAWENGSTGWYRYAQTCPD